MTPSRFGAVVAGVLVTLAIALPASAQGQGQGNGQGHGQGQGNKGGQSTGGKSSSAAPSVSALPAQTTIAAPAGTSPFAWVDDANTMEPGSVWLGVSMVRWHGSGVSENIVPVIDAAIGLAPRVQLGASVPRVAGGMGTTFFSAKIAVHRDDELGMKVAVAPTLEILSRSAMEFAPLDQSRAQWGLPVSVEVARDAGRIYASSGYFSPGVWYAGAGIGRPISERAGISVSFSRAWTVISSTDPLMTAPRRNEISGGGSFDLTPSVAVFGSVGRTVGASETDGAGTTYGFGLSLSAAASAR